MQIKLANPRGFCAGVDRAIEIVSRALDVFGAPIYVRHEVVPAIRMDCNSADIEVWAAGSSIGAFHAVAVTCRFPDLFSRALAMSALGKRIF